MIFGKTYQQRDVMQQAKLKRLQKPHSWYAWHPVKLTDGRWVWLQWTIRDLDITMDFGRFQESRWRPEYKLCEGSYE